MSKQNQTLTNQREKQNKHKSRPDVTVEQLTYHATGVELAKDLTVASDRSVQSQAAFLSDTRLSKVHRQAMVTQIGRVGGNQHLQHVMALMPARTVLTIQRSWFEDIGKTVRSVAGKVGDLIDDIDTKSRNLNVGEIAEAREIFGDTINYSQVVLERNSLYNAGSSRTVGNTIALTDDMFDGKNLQLNESGQYILIHELAHVWQYQNRGWKYAPSALWAQAKAAIKTGSRNGAYDWEKLDVEGVPWEDWNPEAQAQAVEDYNRALRKAKLGVATPSDYKILVKAMPYVDKMRYPRLRPGDFRV